MHLQTIVLISANGEFLKFFNYFNLSSEQCASEWFALASFWLVSFSCLKCYKIFLVTKSCTPHLRYCYVDFCHPISDPFAVWHNQKSHSIVPRKIMHGKHDFWVELRVTLYKITKFYSSFQRKVSAHDACFISWNNAVCHPSHTNTHAHCNEIKRNETTHKTCGKMGK